MIGPNWFDRDEALRRLADDPFDVLVVGGGYTGLRWWRGQGSRRSGRRFRCAEGAPSKPNAANIVVATGWPPCRIPLLAAKGYGLTGKCFMARRQLFLLIRNLLVEYGLKWIILC